MSAINRSALCLCEYFIFHNVLHAIALSRMIPRKVIVVYVPYRESVSFVKDITFAHAFFPLFLSIFQNPKIDERPDSYMPQKGVITSCLPSKRYGLLCTTV